MEWLELAKGVLAQQDQTVLFGAVTVVVATLVAGLLFIFKSSGDGNQVKVEKKEKRVKVHSSVNDDLPVDRDTTPRKFRAVISPAPAPAMV